jgi:hypothetical protein
MRRTFSAKLGKMRKPQEFVAFIDNATGKIIVQSDKSIGLFDPETGKGILNIKGSYFIHLNVVLGAKPFQFPPDFVEMAKTACFKPGDQIGAGVFMGG